MHDGSRHGAREHRTGVRIEVLDVVRCGAIADELSGGSRGRSGRVEHVRRDVDEGSGLEPGGVRRDVERTGDAALEGHHAAGDRGQVAAVDRPRRVGKARIAGGRGVRRREVCRRGHRHDHRREPRHDEVDRRRIDREARARDAGLRRQIGSGRETPASVTRKLGPASSPSGVSSTWLQPEYVTPASSLTAVEGSHDVTDARRRRARGRRP